MDDDKDTQEDNAAPQGTGLDDGGADGGILDSQALGTGDEAATVAETGPGAGGD